jgi:hypothetical protein
MRVLSNFEISSRACGVKSTLYWKLLAEPGLPGKVVSFYIVPLYLAYTAELPGHIPVTLSLLFS